MRVAFRTDASRQIGTGHVMRCLTLANVLRERGADCRFICREQPGNLLHLIRAQEFKTVVLPVASGECDYARKDVQSDVAHTESLGVDWQTDADATQEALGDVKVDWLVVDHYGLDARWETAMRSRFEKLLVIDDLANRPHVCNQLLDQTFGRDSGDYRTLVPDDCRIQCGSRYALLRPQFAALRPYSLRRRRHPDMRQILITLGGVDRDNATGQVLEALRDCPLPTDCRVTVVMGANAPWIDQVREQALLMNRPTHVRIGAQDMAQVMADSDLAIGAAGSTSWERCCLGLPTIMAVLAENQVLIAKSLSEAGAALVIEKRDASQLQIALDRMDSETLWSMSQKSASVTDGLGAARVSSQLLRTTRNEDHFTV